MRKGILRYFINTMIRLLASHIANELTFPQRQQRFPLHQDLSPIMIDHEKNQIILEYFEAGCQSISNPSGLSASRQAE